MGPESLQAGRVGRSRLKLLLDNLAVYFRSVSNVAIVILAVSTALNVAGRYFFSSPILGTTEAVRNWWMPLIGFLGLAIAQSQKEHIEITLLSQAMSRRSQAVLRVCVYVVTLAFLCIWGWYGFEMALRMMADGERDIGAVTVLVWPARFLVPLGAGAFALYILNDLVEEIRGFGRGTGGTA